MVNGKILCVGCGQYYDKEGFEAHAEACRSQHGERLSRVRETRNKRAAMTVEGPVNINTASMEELQTLPAIGIVMAERIIAARPFQAPMDLLRVEGLGHQIWAQLQDYIVV